MYYSPPHRETGSRRARLYVTERRFAMDSMMNKGIFCLIHSVKPGLVLSTAAETEKKHLTQQDNERRLTSKKRQHCSLQNINVSWKGSDALPHLGLYS